MRKVFTIEGPNKEVEALIDKIKGHAYISTDKIELNELTTDEAEKPKKSERYKWLLVRCEDDLNGQIFPILAIELTRECLAFLAAVQGFLTEVQTHLPGVLNKIPVSSIFFHAPDAYWCHSWPKGATRTERARWHELANRVLTEDLITEPFHEEFKNDNNFFQGDAILEINNDDDIFRWVVEGINASETVGDMAIESMPFPMEALQEILDHAKAKEEEDDDADDNT